MTKKEAAAWRQRQVSVLGMVERGGRVRLRVITSRMGEPLSQAVRANVNPEAILITDDWRSYRPLRPRLRGPPASSTTRPAPTSTATSTRTPSRGSSATSRRGCAAPTRRSPASGSSPTWTSTRGATTTAFTGSAPCSTPSSKRRRGNERSSGDPKIRRRLASAPKPTRRNERRPTSCAPTQRGAQGGRLDHSDCCGGRSFPSGRLRPAGGATFFIAASKSPLVGTGISSPLSVFCFLATVEG